METFRRDHSRGLSAIAVIALLAGLLVPGAQLRAQDVDKDGLYSQPFLVLDPDMHTADIRAMVMDAAGRYIITGSKDKTVRVWSANDGRLLRTIRLPSGPGNEGQVFTVAVSPDGNTIAAAGWSRHIFLFERATGRQVGRIGPLAHTVTNKVAFSHDGRRIAAGIGNPNASLRLFDVDSRKEIAFDDKYTGAILGISFDTTGRIATTSNDASFGSMTATLGWYATSVRRAPQNCNRFKLLSRPTTGASLLDTLAALGLHRVWTSWMARPSSR